MLVEQKIMPEDKQDYDKPLQRSVTVEAPVERAFSAFTDDFASWWPKEYTWSQDVLDTIAIEGRKGGRCFERRPHGFECDWGRVRIWEPPHRLVFSWQIAPDRVPEPNPDKASEVEVRFVSEDSSRTRVELEHREFGRHGQGAAEYREGMGSPQGWSYILDRYAAALKSEGFV